MVNIKKHIELLGFRVRDRVTGFSGVVSGICFDLYGCIQATVTPMVDKASKPQDSHWYDVSRLELLSKKKVMDPPNFDYGPQAEGKQGAAEKPVFEKR